MSQSSSAKRISPLKTVSNNNSTCPFLITDCDDDDSVSHVPNKANSGSTAGTPTKRRVGYSRQEKSLGTLTRRFMSLLRQSKTGVMDLKQVADSLATKQKRRIYDITNVLEGVGLIEKQSKNTIRWKGAISGDNTVEAYERLNRAQTQLQQLEDESNFWNEKLRLIEKSISNTFDDISVKNLLYLTHEDLCSVMDDDIVLMVEGVRGTRMKVDEIQDGDKTFHRFHFQSRDYPVILKLLNHSSTCDSATMDTDEVRTDPFVLLTEMAEPGDYLDVLDDNEGLLDLFNTDDHSTDTT